MTRICYLRDGLEWRIVAADHAAAAGEALFDEMPTPEQLASAFPRYRTAISNQQVKCRILALEGAITPRMIQAALSGDTAVNPATGRTDAEEIAEIGRQKSALRAQLVPPD